MPRRLPWLAMAGTVEGIYIAVGSHRAATRSGRGREAVAGQGLRGDRYFRDCGEGTFFEPGKEGQDLTLIEVEALDHLRRGGRHRARPRRGRGATCWCAGIGLNDLVGRTLHGGRGGMRRPPPLRARVTTSRSSLSPGVLRGLVHRGGLRADIVRGGRIAVGDPVKA